MRIERHILDMKSFKVQALSFIPKNPKALRALFTHGYTSSKTSILSWAQRLSGMGIPTIIFDQPGHFLGSFEDISSFEDFQNHFYKLYELADKTLLDLLDIEAQDIIIGGHSLGALSTLKALETDYFTKFKKFSLLVGFGLPEEGRPHLFETKLYEETLEVRRGLVSKQIPPEKVFPWIWQQKKELSLFNHQIHILNGQDDLVVGTKGTKEIESLLTSLGNQVVLIEPKKLPHHEPGLAASHIGSMIKKEFKDLLE